MATPMLSYGSETWALNRSDKRKTDTADMRLRYVAGYNRWNEISNLTIHNKVQIFNIHYKIKDTKKEWNDNIQQMDTYRITYKAV
jgi:hypothetical protein